MADLSNNRMNQLSNAREPSSDSGVLFSHLTSIHVVYFFVGLILCGIPLVVIVTLSFTSSESTISPTVVFPTQCLTYTTLTDSTRLHTQASCCQGDYSLVTGWYRFTGNGGTRLVTTLLSQTSICGASNPGWWNGTLPMTIGATNVGNICFSNGGSSCINVLSPIIATNCSDYYVFYLIQTPCCMSYRYCTAV